MQAPQGQDWVKNDRKFSTVHVERGLHILRYVSSNAGVSAPIIKAEVTPEAADTITLVSAPDRLPGTLSSPGSCAIVVAKEPGTIRVNVFAAGPQGSLDAVVRLELLDQANDAEDQLKEGPGVAVGGAKFALSAEGKPRFVAHLSLRGDVEFSEGEWAAGPSMPSPLEGLLVLHDGIHVQVLSGSNRQWSDWGAPGVFVGTRGMRQTLIGLRFRLDDKIDPETELEVETIYLGSPLVKMAGRNIELISPIGRDPIVGLKIRLIKHSKILRENVGGKAGSANPNVRVLRSRI